LIYEYKDDNSFAQDICQEKPSALTKIHSEFSDKAMYISNKFVNSRQIEDGWQYQTTKGYTINVSDDVSDTYLWLIKQLIQKSCKYKGINKATLKTFLQSILNSSFTFNDWLKWKYGSSEYIPAPIKKMPTQYWDVFKMMRRKKTPEDIAKHIEKSPIDTECIIIEIREILSQNNIIDMIDSPIWEDLITEGDDGDMERDIQDSDENDPQEIAATIDIKKVLKTSLDSIDQADKRLLLLYWGAGMNTSQILSIIDSDGAMSKLDRLEIKQEKDIYSNITRIIKGISGYIENNNNEFFVENDLNERSIKSAVIVYLENFEKYDDSLPLIIDEE